MRFRIITAPSDEIEELMQAWADTHENPSDPGILRQVVGQTMSSVTGGGVIYTTVMITYIPVRASQLARPGPNGVVQ